jgi:hypothetical protein
MTSGTTGTGTHSQISGTVQVNHNGVISAKVHFHLAHWPAVRPSLGYVQFNAQFSLHPGPLETTGSANVW